MNDVINILMVEDERNVVERYSRLAEAQPELNIVYSTGSEHRALVYLQRHPVDVLLLDLELEEGDGVSLLANMEEQKLQRPFTVVVTNTVSNVTLSYVRNHGADYIYQKMNGSYSPLRVLSMIEKVFPYRRYGLAGKEHPVVENFNHEKAEAIMRETAERELVMMGVKRKLVGFKYLVDAIMLYIDCPEDSVYLTGEIYPEIARRWNVTATSVEKAIRCCIESAFMFADINRLHRYYPFAYNEELGRPSNLQFIANMAKRVNIL
jgi:two-component system response regulator (stage 0 sporulation protein A)